MEQQLMHTTNAAPEESHLEETPSLHTEKVIHPHTAHVTTQLLEQFAGNVSLIHHTAQNLPPCDFLLS
jgi:hypothetical protein